MSPNKSYPRRKSRNVITADKIDHELLEAALESQGNAIPGAVATVLRLAAPIIARLVIRYVARKYRKRISDQAINTGAKWAGEVTGAIISRAGTK